MRILVIPDGGSGGRWSSSKHHGPGTHWGLAEVLRGLGHVCEFVPSQKAAIAVRAFSAEPFDQLWFDVVAAGSQEGWQDVWRLAPVRLGFLRESLRYSKDRVGQSKWLLRKADGYVPRAAMATHMAVFDEHDVDEFTRLGWPVLWWKATTPAASARDYVAATSDQAAFFGRRYPYREQFLRDPALRGLYRHLSYESQDFSAVYDKALAAGPATDDAQAAREHLRQFSEQDFGFRHASNAGCGDRMQACLCVLQPPTLCGFFPDRVFRAAAVSVPVVSVRQKPATAGLFAAGEEILYAANAAEAADHIRRLRADPAERERIGRAAHRRFLASLTLERQLIDTLTFLAARPGRQIRS